MTPQQKLKWAILSKAVENADAGSIKVPDPCENIEELYYQFEEDVSICDSLYEADKYDIRADEVETRLPCEWSRHYESKSVAMQFPDKSWVGWTYWYGGGKHGEPESIDWIEDAYDLECKEEEKMVVVRTFSIPQGAQ